MQLKFDLNPFFRNPLEFVYDLLALLDVALRSLLFPRIATYNILTTCKLIKTNTFK